VLGGELGVRFAFGLFMVLVLIGLAYATVLGLLHL
jgi:hypothetical protein